MKSIDSFIIADDKIDKINSSNILYKSKDVKLHEINFEECSKKFKAEHLCLSCNCVAERNVIDFSFTFYTLEYKTKILFKKIFIFDIFKTKYLRGKRIDRFRHLQLLIQKYGYTSYDVS